MQYRMPYTCLFQNGNGNCLLLNLNFSRFLIVFIFFCHKWRISTWRQPLQPWPSAESRTHRWAPETDLQWGPRHLDIHRGKTPGTSGPLILWLCCSWNKLLIRLAGGELAPDWAWFLPRFFLHSVTDGVSPPGTSSCVETLWGTPSALSSSESYV